MKMSDLARQLPLRRDPKLISAPMDGELVMMSEEADAYYGLGGIGPRIWDLLEQPISLNQLTVQLCEEFDVDEATCREDAAAFIGELINAKLVHIAD